MRHVPSSATQEADVLSFDEALRPTAADFDRDHWIYIPDHYSEYRYLLGTRGQHPLICIGVNPSTAIPGRLDRTLQSAERIALGNGYDSFLMFNVYAQRATSPEDMDTIMNPFLHSENCKAFEWLLSGLSCPPAIWAAWGAVISVRPYLSGCVRDFIAIGQRYQATWYTAGPRSKAGHPHHPLYLPKNSALVPFTDMERYLVSLETQPKTGKGQKEAISNHDENL